MTEAEASTRRAECAADVYAARRSERARELRALRERIQGLMADRIERYSAEIAGLLGLDVQRAYPSVAYTLKMLERDGILTSRLADAPRSGLGRRYYKWASTVARARARGGAVEARRA